MLDDPTQVLQLQVGNAYMAYHALFFQFVQGRQGLVNHFLQATLHTALELNVVHVDNIDVINVQTL